MPQQLGIFTGKPERKRSTRAPSMGYAGKPTAGPESKRCADCLYLKLKIARGKRVGFKCRLVQDDGTRMTDIVKSMPACERFADAAEVLEQPHGC